MVSCRVGLAWAGVFRAMQGKVRSTVGFEIPTGVGAMVRGSCFAVGDCRFGKSRKPEEKWA